MDNAQTVYDAAVADYDAKLTIQKASDKAVKDATAAIATLKKEQAAALKLFDKDAKAQLASITKDVKTATSLGDFEANGALDTFSQTIDVKSEVAKVTSDSALTQVDTIKAGFDDTKAVETAKADIVKSLIDPTFKPFVIDTSSFKPTTGTTGISGVLDDGIKPTTTVKPTSTTTVKPTSITTGSIASSITSIVGPSDFTRPKLLSTDWNPAS